ncbi:hypothetical protein [Actinocrispum sp. NPDC049592]|uniref:golvesin C-terminal-like domain-containing protein n=1 Tax=Actinocrispum sp. NPDC049592 TaxID=3154835 RepID=UPI0034213971
MSDAANGYVVADAIRVTYQGVVADNDTSSYEVLSGVWDPATGVSGYFGQNYRTHPAGTGTAVVRWHLGVPASGMYQVAVWYAEHPNRASNARYTVGTTTVTVDQRDHGGQWVSLGDFWLTQDTTVTLSDAANGYVVADAVRLIPT